MTAATRFESPFACLELRRFPERPGEVLQAFDAADAYLLRQVADALGSGAAAPGPRPRALVLNDSFGALALSLAATCDVTSVGDSHLAELALEQNRVANDISPAGLRFVPSSRSLPPAATSAETAGPVATGTYDIALIRVPKALALLHEQLLALAPHLAPGALVLAGAMDKHLPRGARDLLERHVGPVVASRGWKKARVLRVTPAVRPVEASPYPTRYTVSGADLGQPERAPLTFVNHAGVFSRGRLDIGARALLPHLPRGLGDARVADLGCGNGVLAVACARENPDARFTLVDESYLAVRSARESWEAAFPGRAAELRVADGLSDGGVPQESLDVVLCNPPFHHGQTVGDHLAWRMLEQARGALTAGGTLWLVGNRHLDYEGKLRRLFGRVVRRAATPKFVVVSASSPLA